VAAIALLVASGQGISAQAAEQRCGWLHNPTPANWWLTDAGGTWILQSQGPQGGADGMDLIPDVSRHDYVRTNGEYGYACACLTGTFAPADHRVMTITSFRQLPLARCRADRALPRP
jgi:hypothetical protein